MCVFQNRGEVEIILQRFEVEIVVDASPLNDMLAVTQGEPSTAFSLLLLHPH